MHTRIPKKTSMGSEENFCLPGCTKPILVFNVNLGSLGGGSDPLDPRITCMPSLKRNMINSTLMCQKYFRCFHPLFFFFLLLVFLFACQDFSYQRKKIEYNVKCLCNPWFYVHIPVTYHVSV